MLPPKGFTPGHWYITVTCQHCKNKILIFEDLNEGRGTLQGKWVVKCHQCEEVGEYPPEHYYHPSPSSNPSRSELPNQLD